jgi:adenylate cyclase
VGNLGSTKRFDYSIVGDTVNMAARMEPLCKEFGLSIIVSAEIAEAAPDFAFLEIEEVVLRGRQQATRLFALLGDERVAADETFVALRRVHEEALAAMRSGDGSFGAALAGCEASAMAARLGGVYRMWKEKGGATAADAAAR